jgi:hypothetical protein
MTRQIGPLVQHIASDVLAKDLAKGRVKAESESLARLKYQIRLGSLKKAIKMQCGDLSY